MDEKKLEVFRDWHLQWVKIPKFIGAAALGAIAISLTLLDINKGKINASVLLLLQKAWILLSISAAFSALSVFFDYKWFGVIRRNYIGSESVELGLGKPPPLARNRIYFILAECFNIAGVITLLVGVLILLLYANQISELNLGMQSAGL